ncbi:MAG: diguanylate cyclase (GGDEF)-like protein [Cellvibrionaceae bacterium]|jgi:diguanylate cyclase (GGDEF)-like protein
MSLDPNEKKSRSVRRALVLALLGLQLSTVLLILFVIHFSSERDIDAQITVLLQNALNESKAHTEGFLEPAYRMAQMSADVFSKKIIEVENDKEIEDYFLSQLKTNTEMTGIYLATPEGGFHFITRNQRGEQSGYMTKVIAADKPGKASFYFRDESLAIREVHADQNDEYNASERPWYRQAVDKEGLSWTEPYIFYTSKQPGITVSIPFYASDSSLRGVIGIDVELTRLSRFLAELKVYGTVSVSMVSGSGNFVATPSLNASDLELDTLGVNANSDIHFDLEKKAVSHYLQQSDPVSSSFSSQFLHDKKKYAIRYEPFLLKDGPEWIISAYAPKKAFLSKIRSGGNRNTLIALTILILSLIVGWILIRKTWQPFEHFFHDVVTDQLTGLFNRRFLENIGSRMYIRLLRDQHEAISIAVIDLDFFSKTNAEFGNVVGNDALIAFSEFLKKTLRPEDIVTRYSGDTFVIIFPGMDNEHAMRVVDRMRHQLDAWPLSVDNLLVRLSFSAGIETIDKSNSAEDAAFSDFIEVAKRAMQDAKQNGRNQVVSANNRHYSVKAEAVEPV